MAMGYMHAALPWDPSLPQGHGQPFYQHLEAFFQAHDFDRFVEDKCKKFYAKRLGTKVSFA